jgi:hypothetical protein
MLSCNTTTIQAELHGLHLALKYSQSNRARHKKIYLFTASITALKICTRNSKISNTAKLCHDLLHELYGDVILNLVSQVSSEGSTTAKQLAKEAASITHQPKSPGHLHYLKQMLDPTCWKYGRKIGAYALLALSRGNFFHATKMQHA